MLSRLALNYSNPMRRLFYSSLAIDTYTENIVKEVGELNVLPEHLKSALKVSPNLSQYAPTQWVTCRKALLDQGFQSHDFLPMITAHPALLKKQVKDLAIQLENWRNCQFGEKLLFSILVRCPVLIEAKDEELRKRIPHLQAFAGTRKNVGKLILGSPNLVFEKWSTIEDKIHYLTHVMKVEKSEIVKSEAFCKSLDELKCRHVFLERLGLYEVRKPKADPNEPSKNPKLSKITDTADKHFAVKVAGVTLGEFLVFRDLFAKELKEDDNVDSGSEEDSDNEDVNTCV